MISSSTTAAFTPYHKLVIAILTFIQFTVILDFMVLSPLGAILMPAFQITPSQFGLVVSAYAFSAGGAGILAAGFADRFDRKKLLLFFYFGFLTGTLLCGLAPNYISLLAARIVTGLFGGVISSISYAIVTDLFSYDQRGRVMGFLQTAFAGSQVLGIPISLYLANHLGWHSPFFLIVAIGLVVGVVMIYKMQSVSGHLLQQREKSAFQHLVHTLSQPRYLQGFAATALLSTGGFMLMPFASAFNVNNLGIAITDLPWIYLLTGVVTIFSGPLLGRLADRIGKLPIFLLGSVLTAVLITIYTRLETGNLTIVVVISSLMFVGISARIISSTALMSALPEPQDRGAYMSIGSSLQQMSGGLAAALAGMIITQNSAGRLEHFDRLGNVIVASTVVTVIMIYQIGGYILAKNKIK